MAREEQPPEEAHLLPGGQNDVPNIPDGVPVPCRTTGLGGKRLGNGKAIDLWAGEGGGLIGSKEAYRLAAGLCWQVCAVETPEAFNECAKYRGDRNVVFGGVIPANTGIEQDI